MLIPLVGTGSDRRRKNIMGNAFGDPGLFEDLMRGFKRRSYELANSLQTDIEQTVRIHLDAVKETLNIIRDENVAMESDRNPEFREAVETQVDAASEQMARVREVVG